MAELVECASQEELVAAVKAGNVAVVKAGDFTAYGSARVEAYGSASVKAYDSASVKAYDSASVKAYDSASVKAYDSARVEASGSATVEAYDSARVEAYGSASVKAYDSASVKAYGSATVRATHRVPVHIQSQSANVHGGVQITPAATLAEWLADYGLEPDADGVVVLYKAVNDAYRSSWGFDYTPGAVPVAPDWDGGANECGGGLHFCAAPFLAWQFYKSATRFVACPIRISDIAYHEWAQYPTKVKAKGCCAPVWEVDIDGHPLRRVTK